MSLFYEADYTRFSQFGKNSYVKLSETDGEEAINSRFNCF